MTEDARTLVDRMVEQGDFPEPALVREIADKGEEAIGPLIEVVEREFEPGESVWVQGRALRLLGHLRARSAIPSMLGLFRRFDDEIFEDLLRALPVFGTEIIEPVLEFAKDPTLPWYPRAMAMQIAEDAAGDDPVW